MDISSVFRWGVEPPPLKNSINVKKKRKRSGGGKEEE